VQVDGTKVAKRLRFGLQPGQTIDLSGSGEEELLYTVYRDVHAHA